MSNSKKCFFYLGAAALVCFALRFASLGILDLLDPTEGRYAAIALTMYLTGDWITPTTFQGTELTPFLGKPPFQFWLTAIFYHLVGPSEFSSRLPSFFATLVTSGFMVIFARTFLTLEVGIGAVIVLLSSVMGFFFSAACMTDSLLGAVIAGAYVSFAHAVHFAGTRRGRWWGYLLFAFFGLGLLCKGPVAIVIFGVGTVPWLLITRRLAALRCIPWAGGVIVCLAIAAPWYLAEEAANPGFLNYFLVHENLLRFLVKDYGDKYGSSHVHMRGTIWLMALGAFFPWSLVLLGAALRLRFTALKNHLSENPWILYALLWGLAPCVFFTVSKQVSFAYVFPGLAGFALVVSYAISKGEIQEGKAMFLIRIWTLRIALPVAAVGAVWWFEPQPVLLSVAALLIGLFMLTRSDEAVGAPHSLLSVLARQGVALVVLYTVCTTAANEPIGDALSSKGMLEHMPPLTDGRLDFMAKIPHSAHFYTRLKGHVPMHLKVVADATDQADPELLAMTSKQWRKLSDAEQQGLDVIERIGPWVVVGRK